MKSILISETNIMDYVVLAIYGNKKHFFLSRLSYKNRYQYLIWINKTPLLEMPNWSITKAVGWILTNSFSFIHNNTRLPV